MGKATAEVPAGSQLEQGEPNALTVEQNSIFNQEIYSGPESGAVVNEGSQESVSKKDGGPFTLDGKEQVVTFGNDSGTIENFQEQLKEMLKQENGKHILEVDGKQYPYIRTDEGITIHTPDYKDGLRLDNNGKVLGVIDNVNGPPRHKLDPEQTWGP